MGHVPVLADTALYWLGIREDGVYVDCTAGAGGHSALIAERIPRGRLIALDRDPAAVEAASTRLRAFENVEVVHRNYGELDAVLRERGIEHVNGILLDAGLSSMQIDTPARGFSFQQDGPLDMRMDPTTERTAGSFLASVGEGELAKLLRDLGDVGPAKRIAAAIVGRRRRGEMNTTGDLAAAVEEGLSFVRRTPEEVRTVFQAIRMAVNEELAWLDRGLQQAVAALGGGGRLVAIAFHSGEDRVVKNALRDAARPRREYHADGRVRATRPPLLRILTPKPVTPTEDEIRANPRAHSARLRAAERL